MTAVQTSAYSRLWVDYDMQGFLAAARVTNLNREWLIATNTDNIDKRKAQQGNKYLTTVYKQQTFMFKSIIDLSTIPVALQMEAQEIKKVFTTTSSS